MEIREKIKNEEKLSNALPVSIKCWWHLKHHIIILRDEQNAYIGAQNL